MKKQIYTLAITTLMAGAIFTSCDSAAKKEEAAKEDVQEAKDDLKDVQAENNAEAVKTANAEEWMAFKNETDAKIAKNESYIAELKARKQRPGKVLDPLYAKQIEGLEQKNRDLKTRLGDYETKKSDWESFKREFNSDMDGLGESLKDLGEDNKK